MTTSRICLGTAQLGLDYGIANLGGRPDDLACEALLAHALERGVTRWDTAPAYGDAEERIGRFLVRRKAQDRVQVVSKLPSPPSGLDSDSIDSWVRDTVESSLRTLNVDHLASCLIHDARSLRQLGEPLWDALRLQRERGLTDSIGVSVYSPQEANFALREPDMAALQAPVNLLDTRCLRDDILGTCTASGVTFYARSVFLQGVFTLAQENWPARIAGLAAPRWQLDQCLNDFGLTAVQAALPFVLSHEAIDFVVIGVDNVQQLDENLAAAERALPAMLVKQLRDTLPTIDDRWLEPRTWS